MCRSLFSSAKRYERLKKRAQTTNFGTCTAADDGSANGDDGQTETPATSANVTPEPKPKRRAPAKPRASGKGKAGVTAATASPSEADDAGPPSGEAPNAPVSNKRKRESSDDASSPVSDAGVNAAIEAAGEFTGSRFVAVNSASTREPVPKRAKAQQAAAAIKLEAENEAKEAAEEALVAVKNEDGVKVEEV